MEGPRFVSTTEAGKLLGLGRIRVWQLARSGELPAISVGRRLLIDLHALDALSVEQSRQRREGSR